MLTKLHTLKNIGLFENGTPQALAFAKANLIYAENGRGKTTLTTVLRSCSENDAAILTAKKTLDIDLPPKVGMLAGTTPITFENGAWSSSLPNIVIFDGEFVERNVYAGHEVRPDQRQSLLEFVLGDSAVALKQQVDRLTAEGAEATKRRNIVEAKLNTYRGTFPIKDFRELPKNDNLNAELELLQNQIAVARQQQGIIKRPALTPQAPLSFDLATIFHVLNTTLAGIQRAAETCVKAHVGKYKNTVGLENWIAQGQIFTDGVACPFCAQPLNGLELIEAYQSYFNAEYNALKNDILELPVIIARELSETVLQSARQAVNTNRERVAAWDEQLKISTAPLDINALSDILMKLRVELLRLAEKKKNSPLESVGSAGDRETFEALLAQFNQMLGSYNVTVNAINTQISDFKTKLAATDVVKLELAVKQLELQRTRHTIAVVNDIAEYDAAEVSRKDTEQKKTDARNQLDVLMEQTLSQYRDAINQWLVKFGAQFSIEEMKPNYQGGGLPRTEYGLKVREKSVKLGSRETDGPSFGNTLSEGDKRTLAFAFFLSRLFQRADKKALIVVFDDPVSSLDKNRRNQTKVAIGRVATEVEQLIILAHDAYFLRDLEKYLSEKMKVETIVREVKRVANEYSAIDDCDLDMICASDFYHHYFVVQEFVDGVGSTPLRDVSKVLRVLVEGHLHRRFPRNIKDGLTLGQVIDTIKNAPAGNPLSALQSYVTELVDFNEYASRYHHDTNSGADTEPITNAEFLVYAKQALKLIHTGGF